MEIKDIQTKELAAKTGISENTIKTYLREDSAEPKVSKALLIAQAFNVSVEYLATGKHPESEEMRYSDFFKIQQLIKDFPVKELRIMLALAVALKENI